MLGCGLPRCSNSKKKKQTCLSVLEIQDMWVWPCIGKVPWRRKWQPTPLLLPGESRGQRSLVGYSPWGSQIDTRLKQLSMHAGMVCLPLATGVETPPSGLLPLALWRKACPLTFELCVGPDGPAEVEQIAGRCWLRPDGPFLAEGRYRSFHFGPVDSLWKYYMVFS